MLKNKILAFAAMLLPAIALAQAPAFPGAEGSGRYVSGGRGGQVIHVTNLNDSGIGSLRDALKVKGKKTIVFDVGGVIALQSNLFINSNTTILGQTAPYPGITLRYYTTQIKGDNVIVRFLRFRRGQEKDVNDGADTFWGNHHTGIIIDHCSMSWSIDEIGSFYDNNNFTLQWCVYGESLNNAGHNKGAHGYGGIWGGKLASFHHNMIAHTSNRAPRFNGARYDWKGYTGNRLFATYNWQNAVQAENVDFRNCLIFDWGGGGCYGGPGGGYVNIVNNYYKSTPETKHKDRVTLIDFANKGNSKGYNSFLGMASRYFIHGNYVFGDRYGADYDWKGVKYEDGIPEYNGEYYSQDSLDAYGDGVTHYNINGGKYVKIKLDKENAAPVGEVTTHTAQKACEKVMAFAGASLFRDDVDARYMGECAKGLSTYTGSVTGVKGRIDVVADCDGYTEKNFPTGRRAENYDTDGDGMPDVWEKVNALNPSDPSDGAACTLDKKGYYTNLEVYANSLVEDLVKAQNADALSAVDEYFPACKRAAGSDYYTGRLVKRLDSQTQKNSNIKEQKIFATTFSDWTDVRANNNSPVNVKRNLRFTGKTVTFKVFDTQISSTNANATKFPLWHGGCLVSAKSNDSYILTSPIADVTKVHFRHGATGSDRGWKLEAKGDGDSDWVTLSSSSAEPPSGCDVTVAVDRKNCQLRLTNLTDNQNAYLFKLEIFGNVDMTGKKSPEFTVTYHNTDGAVLARQTVSQDSPIGKLDDGAKVSLNGGRFRGWLLSANGSQKATPQTVVTDDINLYPLVTDVEGSKAFERNVYDFSNPYFYPEDHEALEIKDGKVNVRLGGNATVIVRRRATAQAAVDTVIAYKGKPTTLAIPFKQEYISKLIVINTGNKELKPDKDGCYIAEAGNAQSVLGIFDLIAASTSCGSCQSPAGSHKSSSGSYQSSSGSCQSPSGSCQSSGGSCQSSSGSHKSSSGSCRVCRCSATASTLPVLLPAGTYDFGTMTEILLPADNVSIIGAGMDSTILVTTPEVQKEGLGTADFFFNTHNNIRFESLTLKNALGYYKAGGAGRAAVIQDCGNRTIYNNVRMLSYQDTYYSQNNSMQSYFLNCEIHGTVDFICGGGDVRFDSCTIVLEPRKADGTGNRIVTAPSTTTKYGYVFDGCKIVDKSNGKGEWNFGRTWRNNPVSVFLNTTFDDSAAKTLIKSRWIEKGMNNANPKVFGEFNTTDSKGEKISPESNIIISYDGGHETILTSEQAAAYSYGQMFKDWNPRALCTKK